MCAMKEPSTPDGLVELPLYMVSAFTSLPYSGNPAAVCLVPLGSEPPDDEKQRVAAEINSPDTVYCLQIDEDNPFQTGRRFQLRWFTPSTEIPLCGHATLATAAVLFNSLGNPSPEFHFDTLSGDLTVRKGENDRIVMNLPNGEPVPQDASEVGELLKVVVGEVPIKEILYSTASKKLLIRLEDTVTRETLESLNPPANLMLLADNTGYIAGVIVTLKGTAENGCQIKPWQHESYDFVSRYFTPWHGVNEDPVTGSAHAVMAPYWSKQLGKTSLLSRQCSKRGGDVWTKVLNDERVEVSGHAYVFIRGILSLRKCCPQDAVA